MKIIEASHTDHSLTEKHIAYILEKFQDREGFFIETFELPNQLGQVPSLLYGPAVGDPSVPESEVTYVTRGDRPHPSRMINRPARLTRTLTVIAGPHGSSPCVLYTAHGGPCAPKEPQDAAEGEERKASEAFWAEHALALE